MTPALVACRVPITNAVLCQLKCRWRADFLDLSECAAADRIAFRVVKFSMLLAPASLEPAPGKHTVAELVIIYAAIHA